MRWSQQNRKLNGPENEMRNHLLRGDSDRFGNMVRDVEVRWPDSTNTLGHSSGTSISLNSMPEKSSNHSDDNCESSKMPAKSRFKCYWEGNMKTLSNSTVENQRYCADQATKYDANDRLAPTEVSDLNLTTFGELFTR
jgi:hypothetical protein